VTGEFQTGDAAYAERIFEGGSRLTRWSHRRRGQTASRLLGNRRFEHAVDVGGADGWFLRSLLDAGLVAHGTVLDIDPALLDQGRAATGTDDRLDFVLNEAASVAALRGTFDLAVCMETLEHVPDPAASLDEVVSLLRPGGALLVTVPVEVGPALLGKQLGRWFANRRGTYGYERYAWPELLRAGVLWDARAVDRGNLHSHKGFDYRAVRRAVEDRVTIERTRWSPVQVVGPLLASTVSWLGRPRA
jgi:2-polyprenyl-3-methyl-5-hydroxy-6-metoxy-1,4-benzoquinol methylase